MTDGSTGPDKMVPPDDTALQGNTWDTGALLQPDQVQSLDPLYRAAAEAVGRFTAKVAVVAADLSELQEEDGTYPSHSRVDEAVAAHSKAVDGVRSMVETLLGNLTASAIEDILNAELEDNES